MLKPLLKYLLDPTKDPAAFRRLCVETSIPIRLAIQVLPAAFRRLCVETFITLDTLNHFPQPPSGGCVLKHQLILPILAALIPSRLQAAVC